MEGVTRIGLDTATGSFPNAGSSNEPSPDLRQSTPGTGLRAICGDRGRLYRNRDDRAHDTAIGWIHAFPNGLRGPNPLPGNAPRTTETPGYRLRCRCPSAPSFEECG